MTKKCIKNNCLNNALYRSINNPKKLVHCMDHTLEHVLIQVNKPKVCAEKNCNGKPNYNFEGYTKTLKKGVMCFRHKLPTMVFKKKYCIGDNCSKSPSYGYLKNNIKLCCKDHKLEDMIDINNKDKMCVKCKKVRAIFNYKGQKIGKYCKKDKLKGMINVKDDCCKHLNCDKNPKYNKLGEKKGLYCMKHASKDMINVVNKKCIDCDKIPNFNIPGLKSGIYCGVHKKDNMIDVSHKTCERVGCFSRANFNFSGEKSGKYCAKDKEDGMIDLANGTCKKCNKQPSWNYPGNKKRLYCATHKLNGMIDLLNKNKICLKCDKGASFNYKGKKQRLYCNTHALEGMINVKVKRCTKCDNMASYGKPYTTRTHCGTHRNKNEYVLINPKCETSNCKNPPFYSDTNYPKRCEKHALKTDSNIIETKCKSCGLKWHIKSDIGLCNDCYEFKNKKVQKAKENRVKDLLDANGIKYKSHDKIPDFACSKYRPDFIIEKPLFTIILEVDENQHKSYACECEQGRMIQLHQDFGGTPVVFVRYNPDNYKDDKGDKHKFNKRRESKLIELLNGLDNRKEWNIPLSVYYLFYDDYNGINKLLNINY